jgi:hypothetical protein
LATRLSRTVQAIHQFSARNHAEILYRKRELQGLLNAETADDWLAEKGQYYGLYEFQRGWSRFMLLISVVG